MTDDVHPESSALNEMTAHRAYRYAVYFAPDLDGPWWEHAGYWLGRCAASQQHFSQPLIAGVSPARLTAFTAHPRRYGFHATMRAPFVLSERYQFDDLVDRVNALCQTIEPFVLPRLRVNRLDQFIALTPERDLQQVKDLESQCVTSLQELVEPLSSAELARRRQVTLSPVEDALLVRWGYPYVLDRFRFHFSLTGSLEQATEAEISALMNAAHQQFDPLPLCAFKALTIFAEPTRGADFVLLKQCPLIGEA